MPSDYLESSSRFEGDTTHHEKLLSESEKEENLECCHLEVTNYHFQCPEMSWGSVKNFVFRNLKEKSGHH